MFKYKLAIFDFSGTLAYAPDQNKDLEKEFESFGFIFNDEFPRIFFKHFNSSVSWEDLSKKLINEFNINKEHQKDLSSFLEKSFSYKLYPDAKEILSLDIKIAILSANNNFIIKNVGLPDNIKIFSPKETIYLKPDKRAFLTVSNNLKLNAKDCVMIGDEEDRDLIPANELGMGCILIDRKNKTKNPLFVKINSLKELKNVL